MDNKEKLTEEQKKKAMEAAYAKYLRQLLEKKRALEKLDAAKAAEAERAAEAEKLEVVEKLEAVEKAKVETEIAKDISEPKLSVVSAMEPVVEAILETEKQDEQADPKKMAKEATAAKKAERAAKKAAKKPKASEDKRSLVVRMIDAYDAKMEKFDEAMIYAYKSMMDELFKAIRKYRASRKSITTDFIIIVLMCCAMLLVFNKSIVYEYAYNGRTLGYVDDQSEVTDVLSVAGKHLSTNNNVNVEFIANENVTFSMVSAEDKTIDTSDEAVNKLAYMTDVEIAACGIYEDGVLKAITDSEASAKVAVNSAIAQLSKPDKGMTLISAETTKGITFKTIDVMLTSVLSETQTAKALTEGGEQKIYHIVLQGETIPSICKTYSVNEIDIYNTNEERISSVEAGEKICIHKKIEAVEVKMVEKGKMVEIIPFETIEKESDQVYKGDTAVETEGVDGRQTIDGTLTKVGGKVVKRNLKSVEVIVKKVDKVVLIGTADRPKEAPTGTFKMPIANYYGISDRYGYRWGKIHEAIDFSAATGTPVFATDGGTITSAGWADSYGYRIIIDHGNGNTSWYCHLNEMYLGVGDKVYQGQTIGEVGSTGFSTGPHLHFELRKNDESYDPGPVLGLY